MKRDPRYEIENEEIKALLHGIGARLKELMPTGWGFTLMIFEYKAEPFFYMSTAGRADMIRVLREFIAREETN